MKNTTEVAMILDWNEKDLFWYRIDLAEQYLISVETLKQDDARILMACEGFWNWWNKLVDNAIDLWLALEDHGALTAEASFSTYMQAWLAGANVHQSFWDANYETMIKDVIKSEVKA